MRHINAKRLKIITLLVFAGLIVGSLFSLQTGQTAHAAAEQGAKYASAAAHGFTDLDVKQGERLFKGLLPFRSGFTECGACHYSISADTINWNPSVFDIATNYVESGDTAYLRKVMANPSAKMLGSHDKIELTDKEYYLVSAYLHKVHDTGLAQHKPFPAKLLTFLGSGILMLLALIDLLFTRVIKFRAITMILLLAGAAIHIQVLSHEAIALSRTPDYAPDQPIKFSHAIHAGEHGIDCEYCHFTVRESKSAGIPPVSLCLNCHNVIRNGTNSGRFEINKIHDAVAKGKNVEWIRVHSLADHAYFNHAQHVNAGKLECEDCHGPVETMDIIRQHSDLSMGWCIDCHRQTPVDFEGNAYYSTFKKLQEKLDAGEMQEVKVSDVGGLNCMKCHY